MKSLCFTICRFSLAAWVGAASLFVVTGIQEVRSPEFDSVTKSALATLRFPSYYAFGFGLVSVALLTAVIAARHRLLSRWRAWAVPSLVIIVFVMMVIDYVWVYRPLAVMNAAVTEARPASFEAYHNASMYMNAAHVGLCLSAALILCWPVSERA